MRRVGWIMGFGLVAILASGNALVDVALRPLRHGSPEITARVARSIAVDSGSQVNEVSVIAADGARLVGTLIRPAAASGRAVMLLHGISDSRKGLLGFAPMLLRRGYSVLAMDSRAHGESGGELATYGLLERDDIHRWAELLKSGPGSKGLYALGESMGAANLLQSLDVGVPFSAVVAESSYSTFHAEAYDRYLSFLPVPHWVSMLLWAGPIEGALVMGRVRYGLPLWEANPIDGISKSKVPVLLVQDELDSVVPEYHAQRLLAANPLGKLWRVPGALHSGAWAADPEEFERRVCEWFDSH